MRIRAITPIHVGGEELRRRQARYNRLAPPGLELHLHDLPDGSEVPRALGDDDAVRASEAAVAAAAAETDPNRYDVIVPDCVLDPAVGVATAPLPLVGISALVVHHLTALGRRYAIVTRNRAISDEYVRKLAFYGFDGDLTGALVLDLAFDAIADDRVWDQALRAAREKAAAGGAAVVVNGCSAVDLLDAVDGLPPALDPTALALRLLAAGGDTVLFRPEREMA